jgi:hypothetical protein
MVAPIRCFVVVAVAGKDIASAEKSETLRS